MLAAASLGLARSDGVPDAEIARYFSAILETVGEIVGMWEIWENWGISFFLLIRIGFFTIVVSAIIQRAILHIRDGQISVFQNSNHTRKQI